MEVESPKGHQRRVNPFHIPSRKKPHRRSKTEESEDYTEDEEVVEEVSVQKRKREEKSLMAELREMVEEGVKQKEAKRVEQDQRLQAGQTEYILHLTQTVTSQQNTINQLNKEIFNVGTRYRLEQADLKKLHVEERDSLLATITSLQERVDSLTKQPSEPVLQEPKPRPSPPPIDATLYTWSIVESNNPRCHELYGFTAPQLASLFVKIGPLISGGKSSRGGKPTFGDAHLLLLFLYHFRHYPTLKVMHEKFGLSITTIQATLTRMITTVSRPLFSSSFGEGRRESSTVVYGRQFLLLNVPKDSQTASDIFDVERGQHGLHIHSVHDTLTGRVVAYYTGSSPTVDPHWLSRHEPVKENAILVEEYAKRMRSKFAIASSRFRGTMKECDAVVGCLLALVNLDISS
jgi:hypothetical protein